MLAAHKPHIMHRLSFGQSWWGSRQSRHKSNTSRNLISSYCCFVYMKSTGGLNLFPNGHVQSLRTLMQLLPSADTGRQVVWVENGRHELLLNMYCLSFPLREPSILRWGVLLPCMCCIISQCEWRTSVFLVLAIW